MHVLGFALPLAVILPFIAALLIALSARNSRVASWGAALAALVALLVLIPGMSPVFAGQTLIQSWQWVPAIGLEFAFRLDGLSLL
ncbi:MAG: multicomponent K+:H+ antiporter subunit A, partial [Verrucomicrobiales bacterium]